jgi:hypothetical protein
MDSRHSDSNSEQPPKQGFRNIASLVFLLLLVNLAASLYQLPLNRVVERRLCREYYLEHDPSVIGPDGDVGEDLCKVNEVQEHLAWIQGVMDTAWIVGGESTTPFRYKFPSLGLRADDRRCHRLCHDDSAWLHG